MTPQPDAETDPASETAPAPPRVLPPDPESLREAARVLRAGGLVAMPTETVYGLAADASNPEAVAAIYRAKGRPPSNPLIVHVPDVDAARALVRDAKWPSAAERLARAHWPGPLTLVLPRDPRAIPPIVSAGLETVAIRVPAHPVALALLRAAGIPLAAPSANRSERLSPTTPRHVLDARLPGLRVVLDGGPCARGIESTVVDLSVDPPVLLRPGPIPPETLRNLVPDLRIPDLDPDPARAPTAPKSPGQHPRHYAPRARLVLVETPDRLPDPRRHPDLGVVTHAPALDADTERETPPPNLKRLPDSPEPYAAALYAALHDLDARGVRAIHLLRPPQAPPWRAVHDRLRRAAAPPRSVSKPEPETHANPPR